MQIFDSGSTTIEGSYDKDFKRSYTRGFRLWASTDCDEPYILSNLGLYPLAFHPGDRGARATNIKVTRDAEMSAYITGDQCFQWSVTVEYGYIDPFDIMENGDPLSKPLKFRFEPDLSETEIVHVDVNPDDSGNPVPILNKAYQAFDPPVERPRGKGVITITKNVSADYDFIAAYDLWYFRRNEAAWNGFAENTLLTQPFRLPEIQYSQEAKTWYYPMEWSILYDPNGWTKKVLNAGLNELNDAGDKWLQILVDGQPASEPQLLDGSGKALPLPVSPEDINFIDYDIYETRDYGLMELDNLFTLPNVPE